MEKFIKKYFNEIWFEEKVEIDITKTVLLNKVDAIEQNLMQLLLKMHH